MGGSGEEGILGRVEGEHRGNSGPSVEKGPGTINFNVVNCEGWDVGSK